MTKPSAAGALLAALVFCAPLRAAADPPPETQLDDPRSEPSDDAALALLAGAGVTFVSLGTGGLMIARGQHEFVKNAGLLGMQSGMVLAPLTAHAVVGESRRGLWFSLPLLVPIVSNSIFTGLYPSIIKRAPAGVQYVTWTGVTLSILVGSIGVLDAARVATRRPKRAPSVLGDLTVAPLFGAGTTGAMLSGSL